MCGDIFYQEREGGRRVVQNINSAKVLKLSYPGGSANFIYKGPGSKHFKPYSCKDSILIAM